MSLLPGIPKIIKNWNQFEVEVRTLGYDLHWHHYDRDSILRISGDYRRDGIDTHYAFERSVYTKFKNLTPSKKKVLEEASGIIEDLTSRLTRVNRILPVAKALVGEHSEPVIYLSYIEIPNYRYVVRVHDDLLVQVLLNAQFNYGTIDDLETELRKMTRMKEEYEDKLEPFMN